MRMNDDLLVSGRITSSWNSIYKSIKCRGSLMIRNKFRDVIKNWRMRCSANKIMKVSRGSFMSGWFPKRWIFGCVNRINRYYKRLTIVKRWDWMILVLRGESDWLLLVRGEEDWLVKSWVWGIVIKFGSCFVSEGNSKRKDIFFGSLSRSCLEELGVLVRRV